MATSLDQHIVSTPGVAHGKPRIAGHRITVQNVMIWHERMGMTAEEIASEYGLTLAQVYTALAYYFDHKDEIDEAMRASEAFVAELRRKTPSVLKAKLEAMRKAKIRG
ncbi:MAG: DUF433 domain-containing protein [Planctomycetes bacterium]|nr:DUF433 domain-containing protein [Planctomycetota bacterium]